MAAPQGRQRKYRNVVRIPKHIDNGRVPVLGLETTPLQLQFRSNNLQHCTAQLQKW